jgi:hypothetical protein
MMLSGSSLLLHAGQDVPLLAYLYRVVAHLIAFGGIALLVYSLVRGIDVLPFPFVAGRDTDETEG